MKRRSTVLAAALAGLAVAVPARPTLAQAAKVDAAIPRYQQSSGVSGSLKSVGSDTMNNEMTLWAEGFRKLYPSVKIEIEGKGSSTAPPALTEGTAQFGPMSREMKAEEVDRFEAKHGYKPTGVRTSIDMVAVYVHKDNPIECLSLQQIDAIFSKTRRGGAKSDIRTWGDLGLKGEWKDKPISLYGRNSASGTYGYFKEAALFKGDYKDSVKEQPGSSSVVQGVASDRFGIGYSGLGYKTADVKPVPLSQRTGQECFPATPEHSLDGSYPLSRFLLVYINQKPGGELEPLRREFLRYVLSQEGQEAVVKDGYLPLPGDIVQEERARLKL